MNNLEKICQPNKILTKELLRKDVETHHMIYKGYRANHLSHGLVALCFLGASEEKLNKFYNKYSEKLENKPELKKLEITKENYKNFVGNENYCDLYEFFKRELKKESIEKVLENYLPFISRGIIGGAFHGIIHLGYVLEKGIGEIEEISSSLAHCVMSSQDIGDITETDNKEIPPIESIVKILSDLPNIISPNQKGNFVDKVNMVLRSNDVLQAIAKNDLNVRDTPENVQIMLDTIMKLAYMIGVDHFFIIHLVTSFRSIKTLLKYVWKNSDENSRENFSLINYFWRSTLLAYIVVRCPPLKKKEIPLEYDNIDWDSVVKDVFKRDVDDEHIIKLVFVAKQECKDLQKTGRKTNLVDEKFYFNFAKKSSQIEEWIYY